MIQVKNAAEFSLADGVYVATTTMHLERTVYLKITTTQLESFPEHIIPSKKFQNMKKIVGSDKIDRLLVPTNKGYCVQTLIGTCC